MIRWHYYCIATGMVMVALLVGMSNFITVHPLLYLMGFCTAYITALLALGFPNRK